MERVAILGGTFNPIHNGHLKLAENALRQFALDSCWFMPAPNPHTVVEMADEETLRGVTLPTIDVSRHAPGPRPS